MALYTDKGLHFKQQGMEGFIIR